MGRDKERYASDPIYRNRRIAANKSWERADPAKSAPAIEAISFGADTASPSQTTRQWLHVRTASVPCVGAGRSRGCASITRTRPRCCARCCVTDAIVAWVTSRIIPNSSEPEPTISISGGSSTHAREPTPSKSPSGFPNPRKERTPNVFQHHLPRRNRGCAIDAPCHPARAALPARHEQLFQPVACSLMQKAGQGVAAIKEVVDRIDGKTLPGAPESHDGPTRVNLIQNDSGRPQGLARSPCGTLRLR